MPDHDFEHQVQIMTKISRFHSFLTICIKKINKAISVADLAGEVIWD